MTRLRSDMITPNFRPSKRQKSPVSAEEAMVLALGGLEFLASDTERLDHMLSLTGLSPENLREGAHDAGFLGGILDYFLTNEPLLLEWAESADLPPEVVADARRHLPGEF